MVQIESAIAGVEVRVCVIAPQHHASERADERYIVRVKQLSDRQMESIDPDIESTKRLSDLEEGDIVVLTLDPGFHIDNPKFAAMNRAAVEKTARITLKLSNSLTVEGSRFSISSGKEMENVGDGQWRIAAGSKIYISVPTEEQLARLPDPEGNYTEAQILQRREKKIEDLLSRVRTHLDLDSPEFDQRASALSFFLMDENLKETLEWALGESIERVKAENKELKSRIRQLAIFLDHASALVDRLKSEIDHS
jgi:hypothetical protein